MTRTTLRRYLPALPLVIVLWPAAAPAALTMQGVRLTDVTPSAFVVTWKASGPSDPDISVFSDAAGANDVTRSLEVTRLPLQGGDPVSMDEMQRQAAQERIRAAASAQGHMRIGVQGCLPGTTYYYRVVSLGPGGETVVWPTSGLAPVTTARENSFLADARQILVSITDQGAAVDATGWVVSASSPEALSAVSAFAGDGCAANQAILNLGRMFGAAGGGWLPGGARTMDIEIVDPAGSMVRQGVAVDFSNAFRVSSVVALNVALDQANAAPVAAEQTVGTNEDAAAAIVLTATDADNDALTYAVVTGPAHGSLSGAAPELTYTPAADYAGADSFTFRASDGSADSPEATVSITVAPVNDAPSFVRGADQTLPEDAGAQSLDGWATALSAGPADESAQTLAFDTTSDNSGLFSSQPAVSPGGALTFTAAANANGVATVTVRLGDSGGTERGGADASAAQQFTITVTPVNDAPVLVATGDRSVAEGNQLVFTVAADDVDGDALAYGALGLPGGATLDPVTGAFSWNPGYGQAGNYPVTLTASDGSLTDEEAITITVTGGNRPPVIDPVGDSTVAEGATLAFTVLAADPDGAGVGLSAIGLPAWATFDPASGLFSWRPRLDQAGVYAVTFRATDTGAPPLHSDETVTIRVGNPAGAFFSDDFKNGASPKDWKVLTGSWSALKGVYTAGSLLKNNLVRVLPLDPAAFPLGAGVLQAKVKLAPKSGGVTPNGLIVFAFQSGARCRWVRVAADGISIGQTGTFGGVKGGTKKRLAMPQPIGTFQTIKVKVFPDGWVRVYKGTATTPVLSHRFLLGKAPSVVSGGVGLAASRAKTVFDNITVWEDSRL